MNNLDRQYIDLLADILENGTKKKDRTGVGTYSVFGRQMRFKMSEGFPLLTTKKIYTKAMFHELLWFLKGGDNIKYLVDNDVRIWNEWPHKKYNEMHPDHPLTMDEYVTKVKSDDKFAHLWGQLGPVYGKQWVSWECYDEIGSHYSSESKSIKESDVLRRKPINQIDQIIDDLKNNPDSRRIMVSAWNPGDLPKQLIPPCHYAFQLWTNELTALERDCIYTSRGPVKLIGHIMHESEDVQHDKIVNKHVHDFLDGEKVPSRGVSLMFQMRSADLGLGFPFDIASYATLLHMIAQCVGMQPDELLITTGDTHIYLNQVEALKMQMARPPFKLPTLHLNPEITNIFDFKFEDLEVRDYKCHPPIKMDVAI